MSFLAGRLAATEGSYFLQESKQAVNRLAEKVKPKLPSSPPPPPPPIPIPSSTNAVENQAAAADVLPEVLKHNLPPKFFQSSSASVTNSSSFFSASKWIAQTDTRKKPNSVSVDALNPLRAYVSLPQVTFGPKRWQIPNAENSFLASTANELRRDKYTPVNPEKLKAAASGLSQIGKAFVCATVLVFGSAILTFQLIASELELHSVDDIRTKGKDFVQPRFEVVKERFNPLRNWAEDTAKKWHLEKQETYRENPLIKELSKTLRSKTSN
ncbi:hypothetical protein M9H77_04506 [Catharanthus roseus]|uniref:Uncharacterized protein n=1 Tax=Catharanthus roseus TaxID=4058 RepID=A0ACC0CEU3_CATRO|nr:hypothetical protein M9H77_04506 [Catharanthus roseus]